MSALDKELFTRRLTAANSPFVISKDDGITQYTLNLVSGGATIQGSRKLNNLASNAIALAVGQPFNGGVSQGATITLVITGVLDLAAQ